MTRPRHVKPVLLALVGISAFALHAMRGGGVSPPTASAAAAARPNFLVIMTDDQRGANTMQVMRKTLNRLAAKGTTFSNFFATTPSCCPSRASVMTGRYVHNHGVVTQTMPQALPQGTTIQAYLKRAGYATAMVGKFLNSWPLTQRPAWWDHSTVVNSSRLYTDFPVAVDGVKRTVSEYATTFFRREAIRYLDGFERQDTQPWFLYVVPTAPHEPAVAEAAYATAPVGAFPMNAAIGDDPSDAPPYIAGRVPPTVQEREAMRAAQLRTLMSVDDTVARLLDRLVTNGELADTMVVFTSDNGFAWGEHRSLTKFLPYDEVVRVPMIIRWPGRIGEGLVDGRIGGLVDIAPTLMQAAGLAPDAAVPMDGRSLIAPATRGRLLLEYPYDSVNTKGPPGPWAATRTRTFDYIENYDADGHVVFREYYDLAADPWETVNILRDGNPANDPDLAALHARLLADRTCVGDACP